MEQVFMSSCPVAPTVNIIPDITTMTEKCMRTLSHLVISDPGVWQHGLPDVQESSAEVAGSPTPISGDCFQKLPVRSSYSELARTLRIAAAGGTLYPLAWSSSLVHALQKVVDDHQTPNHWPRWSRGVGLHGRCGRRRWRGTMEAAGNLGEWCQASLASATVMGETLREGSPTPASSVQDRWCSSAIAQEQIQAQTTAPAD
jgi:hypothetical protein